MKYYDLYRKTASLFGDADSEYILSDKRFELKRVRDMMNLILSELNVATRISTLNEETAIPAKMQDALILGTAMLIAKNTGDRETHNYFAELYYTARKKALCSIGLRKDCLPKGNVNI